MGHLGESDILARIRDIFPGGADLVDDCGALPELPPGHRLLVTTDVMEEGQHFRMDWHPPEMLGRKLLYVNLSDLDASGAMPLGFTLTLALGREVEEAWVMAFLAGLADASREQGIPVIGGDTVGRPQGLGLGITAFGAARRWLKREALQVGDGLFVDQPLGASLRGLRKLQHGQRWDPGCPDSDLRAHLDPAPRIGLGVRLGEIPEVHACIDLSDGLSKDLRMVAEASGCTILLAPELDQDAVEGGEDFARCFSASLPQDELEARLGVPLICVGEAVSRGSVPLLQYDGRGHSCPVGDRSFDHFAY